MSKSVARALAGPATSGLCRCCPPAYKTGSEISQLGFAALLQKLGPGGALQFIQQYERGHGDYTKERKRLFAGKTVDDIMNAIEARRTRRRR